MKKIIILTLAFLMLINLVSAEECQGELLTCDDGSTNCCDIAGWTHEIPGDCNSDCIPPIPKCDGPKWCLDCVNYCENDAVCDYLSIRCCPKNSPFKDNRDGADGCHGSPFPQIQSDNWYTRQSNCYPEYKSYENREGSFKCDGFNFQTCKITLKNDIGMGLIYQLKNQGKVLGRCNVECTEDSCDGLVYIKCLNYKKVNQGEQIGKCGVNCQLGLKEYQDCEGFIDKFIKRECISGNWVERNEQCVCSDDSVCEQGFKCDKGLCEEKSDYSIYIIIAIILLIIGGLSYFYFKTRKK